MSMGNKKALSRAHRTARVGGPKVTGRPRLEVTGREWCLWTKALGGREPCPPQEGQGWSENKGATETEGDCGRLHPPQPSRAPEPAKLETTARNRSLHASNGATKGGAPNGGHLSRWRAHNWSKTSSNLRTDRDRHEVRELLEHPGSLARYLEAP